MVKALVPPTPYLAEYCYKSYKTDNDLSIFRGSQLSFFLHFTRESLCYTTNVSVRIFIFLAGHFSKLTLFQIEQTCLECPQL